MGSRRVAVSAIVGALVMSGAAQAQPEERAPPSAATTMEDLTAAPQPAAPQPTTTANASPQPAGSSGTASTASPAPSLTAPLAASPKIFSFQFGAAMSWMVSDIETTKGTISLGEAMHLEAGYRLNPTFAVAAHLGVAFGHSFQEQFFADREQGIAADGYVRHYFQVYEAGAALQIFPTSQLWISPWLGFARQDGQQLALGAGFGYDFLVANKSEPSHRLGAFAKALYANGERDESIKSLQLGLAYSFR